jgi:two-component system nitrogen regulation sensor histidine kinase NtrY
VSPKRRHVRFQNRILLGTLIAAGPAWLVATVMLLSSDASTGMRWALVMLTGAFVIGGAFAVRRQVVQPLQSLANLLEALREEDYSHRGRMVDPEDALGEVMVEVNSLSRMLHDQRLEALEAGVLLAKVIAEVDIAVFAFDAGRHLRLANRAAETLLDARRSELVGKRADELGLETMLDGHSGRIVAHQFPGGTGRWEVRKRRFREGGRPHELLVISDLSRALREEERQAWQRIVRVIGHELNSSLTPIRSMASTLRKLIGRDSLGDDWQSDAISGLTIIHDRAASLGRFMGAYARLARLPLPTLREVEFGEIVRRAASLHGERCVVEDGPPILLNIDADQIEQVLINLFKNAVEAAGDHGHIRARWCATVSRVCFEIEDDGPGLARTENLWIPFFTTKPAGTGLGLILSREIIENHAGNISLENRRDARGCIARFTLPRQGAVGFAGR